MIAVRLGRAETLGSGRHKGLGLTTAHAYGNLMEFRNAWRHDKVSYNCNRIGGVREHVVYHITATTRG